MSVTLFHANWVVPITQRVLEDGAVVVNDDGVVLAVGPATALCAQFSSAPVRRLRGALLPGLVNAHTHLELSALRGLVAGGNGLVPWVQTLLTQQQALAVETRAQAILDGIHALISTGTAAVGDVGNTFASLPALATSRLQGTFFHELLGSHDAATGDALAAARADYEAVVHKGAWPQRFRYVQAPHAPYSANASLLRRTFAAASARDERTSIHLAEDSDEVALLARGEGRWNGILRGMGVDPQTRSPALSPVGYLESVGAFKGPKAPLLVHMTFATAADVSLAVQANAPIVLCPRSNQHITQTLPALPAFVEAGLWLALGTDSLASAPSLSLWDDMAALSAAFPLIAPEHWLRAATLGGAQALGLEKLGSLEPGKKPGLLWVELESTADNLLRDLTRGTPARISWVADA